MTKSASYFNIRLELREDRWAAICGGTVSLGATALEAIQGLEEFGAVTRTAGMIENRERANRND